MTGSVAGVDTVVIGAGVSGLTAAARLSAAGQRVRLYEARERVGGRTWTVESATGYAIDVGGQWLGPTQTRAMDLCRELGLDVYPQFHAGEKRLQRGHTLRGYSGTIPALPLWGLIDLQCRLWQLDFAARRIDRAAPWRADARLDAQSMAQWMQRHTRSESARTMIRLAIHAVFAQEPEQISVLQFLSYVRAAGGLMDLLEVDGGAQQTRIAGGAQQLSEGLARRAIATGLDLQLSAPVTQVRAGPEWVEVRAAGEACRAHQLIVAMAPADARRIDFGDAIDDQRRRLFEAQRPGSVIKCVAIYQTPFWRDQGLSGELVSDGEPLRISFDATPPKAGHGLLVGFILGDAARRWSATGDEARRAAVLRQWAAVFGPKAARPVEYLDQDWCREAWTAGCYVGLFGPGDMRELAPRLRRPDGRIHWAGTETATVWTGYIDGAIEAGERAAAAVLGGD